MTDAAQPNVPFFRKKSRPTNNRKRDASPPVVGGSTPIPSSSRSEVILPSRKGGSNLLSAGSKRLKTSQDASAFSDDDEKDGPDVKWTAAGSHQAAAQEILAGDEAAELAERRNKRTRLNTDIDEEAPEDGLYRGQNAYKAHLKKDKEVPKAMRQGPQRSNASTVRTVTITDYQPDVCKDYKETGYCGFGDTCKFLHDRSTYLAGWQIDKQYDAAQRRGNADSDSESDSDSDSDIPFACLICRKPYTEPVVTRCGHYFCSACAIKRYAKTPKCLACSAPTGGIFNRADKVIEKMRKTKEAKEQEGEGSDEDDEGKDVQLEGLEVKTGNDEEDESEDSD